MQDKKVVFMGTPDFSVPVLEMLIKQTNVIAVVTQPDKEVGRKKVLTPCPVKKVAIDNNIKVLTPKKLKDEYQDIISLNPDIIITCAYGQILPESLIYAPEYNTVNVHASLLPKYRGGAPIHHAIINGEEKTGITIMYTEKGLDTGNIISKEEIDIDINDTYDIVSKKLSILGASLLQKTLPSIFDQTCENIKQEEKEATIAKTISREDEHIDFNKNVFDVHNHIRGLSSIPGAYSILDNQNIKIYLSEITDISTNEKPGTITNIDKEAIYVACLDKLIKIIEIQFPGKKKMPVKDLINGLKKETLINKVFK